MKKCELIQSDKGMKNGLHLLEDFFILSNMVKPANKMSGKPANKMSGKPKPKNNVEY